MSIEEIQENRFIVCHTSIMLQEGASGSPLLSGNKVVGILVAGIPDTDICVFQSSESICQLVRERQRVK